MEISYQYVLQCRHNTLSGITPSNPAKYDNSDYIAVIEMGKKYIEEKGLVEFSGNLQGDQYFIELWTAHIIFEYGNPDSDLRAQCIEIIEKYSNHPLNPHVAMEERNWLEKNSK